MIKVQVQDFQEHDFFRTRVFFFYFFIQGEAFDMVEDCIQVHEQT